MEANSFVDFDQLLKFDVAHQRAKMEWILLPKLADRGNMNYSHMRQQRSSLLFWFLLLDGTYAHFFNFLPFTARKHQLRDLFSSVTPYWKGPPPTPTLTLMLILKKVHHISLYHLFSHDPLLRGPWSSDRDPLVEPDMGGHFNYYSKNTSSKQT